MERGSRRRRRRHALGGGEAPRHTGQLLSFEVFRPDGAVLVPVDAARGLGRDGLEQVPPRDAFRGVRPDGVGELLRAQVVQLAQRGHNEHVEEGRRVLGQAGGGGRNEPKGVAVARAVRAVAAAAVRGTRHGAARARHGAARTWSAVAKAHAMLLMSCGLRASARRTASRAMVANSSGM